jgi:hypothetical protein
MLRGFQYRKAVCAFTMETLFIRKVQRSPHGAVRLRYPQNPLAQNHIQRQFILKWFSQCRALRP